MKKAYYNRPYLRGDDTCNYLKRSQQKNLLIERFTLSHGQLHPD